MDNVKQEWLRTQLHWDDKEAIQSRNVPKSVVFNWRKMTHILRALCKEKYALQDSKLLMVDVGCGAGKFYNGLESIVDMYIGIDPSDKMLFRAVERAANSFVWNQPAVGSTGNRDQFFIRGAGEDLPLQSNIADVVLLKSVLDQCYAPSRVISEAYRALKDTGWLLISLSNRNAYYALFRNLFPSLLQVRVPRARRSRDRCLRRGKSIFSDEVKDKHFFQESHQFYFDMMDILVMLRKDQFEIVSQIPIGYFVFPRCLEWLIPERALLKCIDLADRIGSNILPRRGGGFIFAAQK